MSVLPPAIFWRSGLFAALWLILCAGEVRSWPLGLPTVIGATWLSVQLTAARPSPAIRPLMLGRFLLFFFGKSIQGGLDVMARVFHPRLPINPGLIEVSLTIGHESGRIFLANSITLLPGTITTRLEDDRLLVHTLDKELPVLATIQDLESRIATLYGPGCRRQSEEGRLP